MAIDFWSQPTLRVKKQGSYGSLFFLKKNLATLPPLPLSSNLCVPVCVLSLIHSLQLSCKALSFIMSCDGPQPYSLFSLLPLNDRAKEILELPENAHLVSTLRPGQEKPAVQGLDIGFHIRSTSRYTLATIGRHGDIVIKGNSISRIHCSFELDEHNKEEVMLQDRSSNNSTELLGMTKVPFEPGRPHRRVVIDRSINLEFGLGGAACDLYQFQIFRHTYPEGMVRQLINCRQDNPRQTRTIADEPLTMAASLPLTQIHAPGSPGRIRYSRRVELGSGSYGVVWKVANVDTGEHLAVKRIKRPQIQTSEYLLLKREVDVLSRISHVR